MLEHPTVLVCSYQLIVPDRAQCPSDLLNVPTPAQCPNSGSMSQLRLNVPTLAQSPNFLLHVPVTCSMYQLPAPCTNFLLNVPTSCSMSQLRLNVPTLAQFPNSCSMSQCPAKCPNPCLVSQLL